MVDLYGQCAQVTIVHNPIRHDQSLISVSQYLDMSHLSLPAAGQASVGSEVCFQACGRFLRYGSVFLLTSSFPYYSCYFSFSYVRLGCELRYAFEDLAICCFLSAFFVFVVISYPHLDNFPSCLCLIYFMTV